MRHRLFVHLVWTARDRAPLIDAPLAEFLERFLPSVARQERAVPIALGIVSTHLHMLLRLHPTIGIPRLVQRLKGGSAAMAGREGHGTLRWAKGYSLDSVSHRAVAAVQIYVLEQARHHPDEAIRGYPVISPSCRG